MTGRASLPPPASLAADKARAQALVDVSRETWDRLDRLVDLLLHWQPKTNLVAPSTLANVWTRHIADSLQLLPWIGADLRVADLGTGGGFPGLVLACARAQDSSPAVELVESNGKKAAFLREAIRVTGAPASVHHVRIENYVDRAVPGIRVVTARALASLKVLLDLSEPLLRQGARGVFLKGQDVEAELTDATRYWNIDSELHPSKTDPKARIVLINQAKRRQAETVPHLDRG